jgi:hypothetical protein
MSTPAGSPDPEATTRPEAAEPDEASTEVVEVAPAAEVEAEPAAKPTAKPEAEPVEDAEPAADTEPVYADHAYRSLPSLVAGVLLLIVAGVMLGDALINSWGRVGLTVLAAVLLIAPLVVAFTLRPVVLANQNRVVVRNPFRTIEVPWSKFERIEAHLSTVLITSDGSKYQVWALPVSLRGRKRADRATARAMASGGHRPTPSAEARAAQKRDPHRAATDSAVDNLVHLAEAGSERKGARGEVRARWSVWIAAPALIGLVGLVVLLVTR